MPIPKLHRCVLLVLAITSFSVPFGCDSKEDVSKQNQNTAHTIISAIYAYKKVNGAYPSSLSQLVPKFLAEISKPRASDLGWDYALKNAGSEFELGFVGSGNHYTGVYDSKSGAWMIDTK